jgi:hypothetical protein
MDGTQNRFRTLVLRILANFCNSPLRRGTDYLFDSASFDRVTERDAQWFVRAIDGGILSEVDGDFLAKQSSAKERIFWHGLKSVTPRRLTLSIEAIIGIGAIGRLQYEHGWPTELLGLQPKKWAFDLATRERDGGAPVIVGEVKINPAEVDRMCDYFGRKLGDNPSLAKGGNVNWNRKIDWLESQDAKVVWAIGPNGHDRIYRICKNVKTGALLLQPGAREDLDYRSNR